MGVRTRLRTVLSRILFRTLWAPMLDSIRPKSFMLVVRPRTLFRFPQIRLSRVSIAPNELPTCRRSALRNPLLIALWTLLSPPPPLVWTAPRFRISVLCISLTWAVPELLRPPSCALTTASRVSRVLPVVPRWVVLVWLTDLSCVASVVVPRCRPLVRMVEKLCSAVAAAWVSLFRTVCSRLVSRLALSRRIGAIVWIKLLVALTPRRGLLPPRTIPVSIMVSRTLFVMVSISSIHKT